jgi:gamma-glutamyl hercynylcysteine S-oxide synthase
MHDPRLTPAADQVRGGDAASLARALADSRRDTLATFAAIEHALPALTVPQLAELNPPLWELGHLGWFQEFWLARNPERRQGADADPAAPRTAPRRAGADRLYDSSQVAHATRWQLPLPDADSTRGDLAAQLQDTLALLREAPGTDNGLYFFRLALLHEDMHHEAALYMAQGLGLVITDPRWQAAALPEPPKALTLPAGTWRLGSEPGDGFAFDNELNAHDVALPGCTMDAQVLRWAEYLPFVESGAHAERRHWTEEGWRWRTAAGAEAPLYLRRDGALWLQWRHGQWQALDLAEAACHLSLHEALAWCAWAGRRLPVEAEWECAAVTQPGRFRWGDVWEWTASAFHPFPGFRPHPYRDYSAPWFDGRPVLRGASHLTQPRMRHARYRNFFAPHRRDVPAGFRSCSL